MHVLNPVLSSFFSQVKERKDIFDGEVLGTQQVQLQGFVEYALVVARLDCYLERVLHLRASHLGD